MGRQLGRSALKRTPKGASGESAREIGPVRVDGALLHRIDDAQLRGQGISLWGQTDYLAAVHQLAEGLDISPEECARRFGRVRVAQTTQGWAFHPGLGVYKVG